MDPLSDGIPFFCPGIGFGLPGMLEAESLPLPDGIQIGLGLPPLAAAFKLPFYINSEVSLPLVRAMLETGLSPGAAPAFLASGSGTSLGAVAGALTFACVLVVGLVIANLRVGAVITGFDFPLLKGAGLGMGRRVPQ
jgi:hypothetical protein